MLLKNQNLLTLILKIWEKLPKFLQLYINPIAVPKYFFSISKGTHGIAAVVEIPINNPNKTCGKITL